MARDRRATNAENRSKSRRASSDSSSTEDQCHPRKIFIGGLAHKTKTHHLREHFQRYGTIVDAVVLQWPDGRSRGFGYVTFAETAAALAALDLEHQIGGRQVDVKRAVPGTNKLFVGGLPQNATVAELRTHFEAFGVVSDAVVMMDPTTNRSRGFGFVCFLPGQEGATAVADALEQYNNHRIRGKWIEVKSAAPPHKLTGGEGADAEPSPECSPAVRQRGDASSRKPPAVLPGASLELEPQKVAMLGMAPPPPPGLGGAPLPAGARVPPPACPPGLLGAPATKGPPRHVPWPPATMGASQYHPAAAHHPLAFEPEPVKVQESSWASASMDLQRSLEQLLRARCEAGGEPEKTLKSPEKVKGGLADSYFMHQELEFGSPTKAER